MAKVRIPELASLAVGFGLAFAERGNGPATTLAILLVVLVGIPALVLWKVMKLAGWAGWAGWGRGENLAGKLRGLARFVAVFMLVQCLVFPLGWVLRGQDIREARAYCDEVAARLEGERQTAGVYPDNIEKLLPDKDPPRLVRLPNLYLLREGDYVLSFSVGGLLFPYLHRYTSDTGEWEILD